MKKNILLVCMLLLVLPSFMFAQEKPVEEAVKEPTGPMTDHKLLGIQTGFLAGQNLNLEDTVMGRDFALFFTMSNSLQAGFRAIDGLLLPGDTALLFDLSYFVGPVSIDIMAGGFSTSTEVAAGVDIGMVLVRNSEQDVFSSVLKLKAGYLFETGNGVGKGVVYAGLVGSFGY